MYSFLFSVFYIHYWRVHFPALFIKSNLFLYTNPSFINHVAFWNSSGCGMIHSFYSESLIFFYRSLVFRSLIFQEIRNLFSVLIYNVLINLPIWFDFSLLSDFFIRFSFSLIRRFLSGTRFLSLHFPFLFRKIFFLNSFRFFQGIFFEFFLFLILFSSSDLFIRNLCLCGYCDLYFKSVRLLANIRFLCFDLYLHGQLF